MRRWCWVIPRPPSRGRPNLHNRPDKSQGDLQPHLLHFQQRLRIAHRIVDGMVGVRSLAQVLEGFERVLDKPLVERTEVGAGVAERIGARAMPQIPVDELPIEAVVVADEVWPAPGLLLDPGGEGGHHLGRLVEGQRLLARETAHRQRLRNPFLGYGLEAAVQSLIEAFPDDHGAEADHAVVTGDRPVGFHIHHYVGHSTPSLDEPTGVGWVKRSADPTLAEVAACVGSSLTLDPTYARPSRVGLLL